MLFTWDTTNLCVVFRWWHVRGPWSLIFTLLGVIVFGMSYEALRHLARKFDESTGDIRLASPTHDDLNDDRRISTAGKYIYLPCLLLIQACTTETYCEGSVVWVAGGLFIFTHVGCYDISGTTPGVIDNRDTFLFVSGSVQRWDSTFSMMTRRQAQELWRVIRLYSSWVCWVHIGPVPIETANIASQATGLAMPFDL